MIPPNAWIGPQPASNSLPVTVATDGSPIPVQLTATPVIDIGMVDQGMGAPLSSAWPVELTDGSNVLGTLAHPVYAYVPNIVSIVGSIAITNFPASAGSVAVTNFPATQPVSGSLTAVVSGSVTVSNFPATQPVSAVSLPLPANAAQETGGHLASIDSKITNPLPVSGTVTAAVTGSVSVTNFPATQPVSAVALPLPTGAAQEHVTAASPSAVRLTDGAAFYKSTTPADTQPVSAASLPLPAGASTAGNQTTANTSLASIDTKLTNPLPVSAASLPLPAGASTSALQTTGNTSLASIDTKLTNPLPISGSVNALSGIISTSGSITTVGATFAITNAGAGTVLFRFEGTFVGTFMFEGNASGNPNQWDTLNAISQSFVWGSGYGVIQTNTSAGTFSVIGVAGYNQVRVRASAFSSGSAILFAWAASSTAALIALSSVDTNFLCKASQGIAAGVGAAWPMKVTDGTNTTAVKAASTAAVATDPAAVVSLSPNSPVPLPTLTKGTQGSTGVSTQDLKDAGRTQVNYYFSGVASGATTVETLITMTKSSGNSATTTGSTFVVTSGKRYRIQNVIVASRGNTVATAQTSTFNVRVNTAGAITNASPGSLGVRTDTGASALATDRISIPIPDGMEILGDGTLQFGMTANSVFLTNGPTWDGAIIGYEY